MPKMDFPRKVVLHLEPVHGAKVGKKLSFGPGVQDVPEEYVEHPHLKRIGAKLVNIAEKAGDELGEAAGEAFVSR